MALAYLKPSKIKEKYTEGQTSLSVVQLSNSFSNFRAVPANTIASHGDGKWYPRDVKTRGMFILADHKMVEMVEAQGRWGHS